MPADTPKRRAFYAPGLNRRCQGTVTLRDGSKAQCMHVGRKLAGGAIAPFCRQHEGKGDTAK